MFKISEAYLNGADVIGANLSGANLNRTSLIGTSLTKGSLKGASLSEAYLTGVYLNGADLSGANLSGAYYNSNTRFDINFDPIRVGMTKVYPLNTPLEEVKVTTVIEKKRLVFAIAIAEDAA